MYSCYSYTTGTSALPEIYAQARGHVRILTGNALVPVVFYSCNMGTSGLPEMSTRCPRAAGQRAKGWTFQDRPQVPVLQLLCNTFVG